MTLSPKGKPLPEVRALVQFYASHQLFPQQVTFFFKAHIMQGQCRPAENIKDFAWLTKQEIESYVDKHYWDGIKDILSDH